MKKPLILLAAVVVAVSGYHGALIAQQESKKEVMKDRDTLTFTKDVQPLINKKCMSCHYPENEFNSSHLVMDSYANLMKGGKHGSPVVPGNAKKSLLYQKLTPTPPFGNQMPDEKDQKLTPEQMKLIADWINKGAKK